jgi:hypothetical protein
MKSVDVDVDLRWAQGCVEGAWEFESRLWCGRHSPLCVVRVGEPGCILWPRVVVWE